MSGLNPTVFDFMDEIVDEARGGEPVKGDSAFITFGEAFFDQFFGALGHNIRGLNADAKRRAVEFVGSMPDTNQKTEVRLILVSFEEFCDLARQSQGNYDGYVVDFDEAIALLSRILFASQAWVHKLPTDASQSALSAAIADAASKIEPIR
jgi:hypothetical protein